MVGIQSLVQSLATLAKIFKLSVSGDQRRSGESQNRNLSAISEWYLRALAGPFNHLWLNYSGTWFLVCGGLATMLFRR